ncbi:MAG: beta-1,6-N-acetylglucosaminyltransferase [Flavobacterium sp.]
MRTFYLVLAHTNPQQLIRMITQMNEKQSVFLIHVDIKSNVELFKECCQYPNVHFIDNRVNCIWGDYSIVQATLNLIYELEHYDVQPEDRIELKSGQDYPLKKSIEVSEFYKENISIDFIEILLAKESFPRPYLNFKGYKINRSDKRGDYVIFKKHNFTGIYKSLLKGCFKFKYLKYFFYEKKLNTPIEFYKGSNWWSLSYKTLKKIIDYYHQDYNNLYPFFKHSFCVDEYFFQTLLMKIMEQDSSIKIKPTITYVDWFRKGVPLPVTFTLEDSDLLLEMSKQDFLNARKFDAENHSDILDWIDKNILD